MSSGLLLWVALGWAVPSGTVDEDGDGWCPGGQDLDGDGMCTTSAERALPGDCDDAWIVTHPTALEVCFDHRDNDCDGNMTGSPLAEWRTVYADDDGDGWGDSSRMSSAALCEVPANQSLRAGDCDDTDPLSFPFTRLGGDNCDGRDGTVDYDGDGWGADLDCNEGNPSMSPGAAELCFDGDDNNCDGVIDDGGVGAATLYADRDRDGRGDPASPQEVCAGEVDGLAFVLNSLDCDDGDWSVSDIDHDLDGISGCDGDCDDLDDAVNPSAVEIPGNGKDDDCVGGDEPLPTVEDTDIADTDIADTGAVARDTDAPTGGGSGAGEDTDDGTDTDTDTPPAACGGCSTGSPAGWTVPLLGALLWRRRRVAGIRSTRAAR